MTIEDTEYLANWFADNCDGDWEHQQGIKIQTTDNPGWHIQVDLYDTDLENISFPFYTVGDIDTDGFGVRCEDFKFNAFGGANSLTQLIALFRKFVERGGKNPLID
ncbi:immunity 53 family protein [Deinococcus sp. Arct2-2]|uniref:immunity 53 family protein n=1 Tax=Deinococcus sp. Arct2-2 TaxID=2568653 RepID=UPI00197B066F|nr:immunity 53 family protein [Deinococcus sp. Arct2-2]